MKKSKFFKFLRFFFESYDNKLFSHEIKNKLIVLADIVTISNTNIAKSYFKNILLNPKIFLKFDINLQVKIY